MLGFPPVIEKSRLGNHQKHCSFIRNTVKLNTNKVSGIRIRSGWVISLNLYWWSYYHLTNWQYYYSDCLNFPGSNYVNSIGLCWKTASLTSLRRREAKWYGRYWLEPSTTQERRYALAVIPNLLTFLHSIQSLSNI